MRVFQHLEGLFISRAGPGRELGCKALFLVYLSQKDALFDHLTKLVSPATKIYSSN